MLEKVDLSIIILSYNTRELLRQCLQSVRRAEKDNLKMEIIVVDNGSTDESVAMIKKDFPDVRLFENHKNLGFAKGNNRGIKETRGKYLLLLNSDTVVEEETLPTMVKFMEANPKVGVATCRVELADGTLDPACHRGFPTPWASLTYFLGLEKLFSKSKIFGQYHQTFKDLKTIHEIDSPTGAFYLVRREVIDQVGMLDEDFFLYAEDLDWSYRIKQAGWKIMYNPQVKIIHLKKQSGREKEDREIRRQATNYFYSTMKLFYQKHYEDKYPAFVNWLIMTGVNLKWWLANKL